jgi:hypothetical protein
VKPLISGWMKAAVGILVIWLVVSIIRTETAVLEEGILRSGAGTAIMSDIRV